MNTGFSKLSYLGKSATIEFIEGCPNNIVQSPKGMHFRIYRVEDHLRAKPRYTEDKVILKSNTLKTRDISKQCIEFLIKHWEREGEIVTRCKPPRGKKQRAMYSKYHKQQTWGVRNELIAQGVISK